MMIALQLARYFSAAARFHALSYFLLDYFAIITLRYCLAGADTPLR
jgi:hypothetical protein